MLHGTVASIGKTVRFCQEKFGKTGRVARRSERLGPALQLILDTYSNNRYAPRVFAVRGCSSAGRARRSQRRGQEFDPPHLHQTLIQYNPKKCKKTRVNRGFLLRDASKLVFYSRRLSRHTNGLLRQIIGLFQRALRLIGIMKTHGVFRGKKIP